MKGYLLLEGGAEFGGRMAAPDRRAIDLAGGLGARVAIIPTAAAPDNNHQRAGQNGVRWFRQLGVEQVDALPLIDAASANQESVISALRASRLIYLLGGFPQYLAEILASSASWLAILEAYQSGAVIAGSSAGAMVLCQHYYQPKTGKVAPGLNLIPNACLIPHHDTFGKAWVPQLREMLPDTVLVGIDEQTGMIGDGWDGQWNVYGKGSVTLYRKGGKRIYSPGEAFSL